MVQKNFPRFCHLPHKSPPLRESTHQTNHHHHFSAPMVASSSMVDHHHNPHNHHKFSNSVEKSEQDQQQQLYLAQLLAVQQQAAMASSPPAEGNGAEGKNNSREERERREREGSERNTNLIINYLPQTMSQDEVRSLFSSMGEVESCKLIRDKATGQSLGYAFVNYERPEDARKALTSMNGLRLQNKVLKVSLARPSKDDIKGANLYVSGLPKSLTQPELEAAFRPFGSIITSRILSDNVTGLSKGVGFVRFDRKCEAETAIEKMSGTSPWGGDETITVKFANSPSANSSKSTAAIQMAQSILPLQMLQTVSSAAAPSALTLPLATPSLLHSLSSAPTATASAGGPIHAHTPQHRFRYSPLAGAPLISGSGMLPPSTVVSSASSTAVPAALCSLGPLAAQQQDYFSVAALQQLQLQQQLQAYQQSLAAAANPAALNVAATAAAQQQQYAAYAAAVAAAAAGASSAAPQSSAASIAAGTQNGGIITGAAAPSGDGWTLAVHNLGSDFGEPALWRLFGPFGAVLSVKVISKSKGQAQITMANYEEAVAAVNSLNGAQLGGRALQISFKSSTATMLPSLIR